MGTKRFHIEQGKTENLVVNLLNIIGTINTYIGPYFVGNLLLNSGPQI